MTNHCGTIATITLITILILSGECASALAKSLAPIWQPDNPLNANQHDSGGSSWDKRSLDTTINPEMKSDAPIIRHVSSLPTKKRIYLTREWNTGGLPFSILYVNTQRVNARSTAEIKRARGTKRPTDPPVSPTKLPNNRSTSRNGRVGQTRRQYSIIPELFTSYGWSRLGK